jgi:hypothetical protein
MKFCEELIVIIIPVTISFKNYCCHDKLTFSTQCAYFEIFSSLCFIKLKVRYMSKLGLYYTTFHDVKKLAWLRYHFKLIVVWSCMCHVILE